MIKIGLASFALESAGFSLLYMWLLWRLRKVWYKQYSLLLALITSVSGCLSATIPFLVARVYSVDWDLVLWVGGLPQRYKECDLTRGAVATLWFGRAMVIGLCSLGRLRYATNNDEPPLGLSIPLDSILLPSLELHNCVRRTATNQSKVSSGPVNSCDDNMDLLFRSRYTFSCVSTGLS